MRHIALTFAFLLAICNSAVAASDNEDHSATVFPPADCSADEERIITWQEGSETTYCRKGQDVLDKTIPDCDDGQYVMRKNGKFVCATLAALAAGTITTRDLKPGTHTLTLAKPGMIVATGYHWANLPNADGNCSLRYVIRIDGTPCSMSGDINSEFEDGVRTCGNNFMTSASCVQLLGAGTHTITSDSATYNTGGSNPPNWAVHLNGAPNEAVLNYVVTPMAPVGADAGDSNGGGCGGCGHSVQPVNE